MSLYFEELRRSMKMLSEDPRTLFVGQSIVYDGHALFRTLQEEDGTLIVPMNRRIEMPVVEDFQMGFCTGLALQGYIPICIFPRMDFLLLATNQLVNHLDKIALQSDYRPHVIVRTSVGATVPLNSGLQHTQNHIEGFRKMLKGMDVVEVLEPRQAYYAYYYALRAERPVLVVEHQNLYNP